MHHTSKHSGIGQYTNPDAAGIEAAFTDLIASYVQRERTASGHDAALVNPAPSAECGNPGGYRAAAGVPQVADVQSNSTSDLPTIRAGIELARLALALRLSALFRLWLILHELARQTGAQGFSRLQIDTALTTYGVKNGRAYASKLLHRGHGLFWNLHNGMVYPYGYVTVCKRLVQRALDFNLPDIVSTNAPGQRRDMYLDVSGSITDFEAQVLAAWYASKNNPTLSRFLITSLFRRTEVTIRKLERRAGVDVIRNLAETIEPANVPLTADGSLRPDVKTSTDRRGITVYTFNLSNTYHAGIVRQHPKRGQNRRAASVIRDMLDDQLTGNCGAGGLTTAGQVNRIGRHYCADRKAAKQSRRRGNSNTLYVPDRPGEGGAVVWCIYTT